MRAYYGDMKAKLLAKRDEAATRREQAKADWNTYDGGVQGIDRILNHLTYLVRGEGLSFITQRATTSVRAIAVPACECGHAQAAHTCGGWHPIGKEPCECRSTGRARPPAYPPASLKRRVGAPRRVPARSGRSSAYARGRGERFQLRHKERREDAHSRGRAR